MGRSAEHIALLGRQQRVVDLLAHLAPGQEQAPPQSLLLEGGSHEERVAVALHWAMSLNCFAEKRPCLQCTSCRQILDRVFNDLLFIDENYYVDEKKQLSVNAVRALRPVWGQPPNGEGYRVTIFPKVTDLSPDISNSLLKTLEEPRPGNVFVLLTPQRERLLETLVSRSWVLTLAWPETTRPDAEALEWAQSMLEFWRSGRGWFARTMGKPDAELASNVLLALQAALTEAMSGRRDSSLARILIGLDPVRLRRFDLALSQAQDALAARPSPVNPSLVLDWLATRMR